ncbi:MAG: hypothetical protein FJ121_09930 [Deltaproteobacteria bacterium]|nr:hypothetical protein [Deltaproteobacteria bacterium]
MRNISLRRHRRASAINPGRPAFSLKEPSPETGQPRRWRPSLAWAAALFTLALAGLAAPASAATLAGGYYHSLVLKANGSVAAGGDNTYGQRNVPGELGAVVAVAAGYYHSLALKADGSVHFWGDNSKGQLNVPPGRFWGATPTAWA